MAGPIRIAILANGSQARREVSTTAGSFDSLGSKAAGAGKKIAAGLAIGAAVAGAAVVKLGIDSVKAASDSQQSLGATQTVFGKYAADVISKSKQAATAVGLSANEYRELANVTGASLKGAGVPIEKTAALTDDLNKRAADLAATFGGKTSEAVSAFGSLLRGEADPIERYGISVKQSDVNARLAAQGQDKLTGSALKQAEMMARLDLAFQQSKDSAGAFARESDTLANRQQILGAKFEDIKAKIGTALLPVLTNLATFVLTRVVPAIERFLPTLRGWLSNAGQVATTLASKLQPALQAGQQVIATRLMPVVERIKQKFTEWRPTIDRIGNIVAKILPVLVRFAGYLLGQYYNALITAADIVVKVVGKLIDFGAAVGRAAGTVADFARRVKSRVDQVIKFFTDLPDKVKAAFSGAKQWLVESGKNVVQGLIDGLEAAKQWVIDKVQSIADLIPGWLKKRLGIASPSKVTKKIGEQTGKGLEVGLNASKSKVGEAAAKLADTIRTRFEAKIASMEGLRDSITSMRDSLASALTGDLFSGTGDESGTALDKFRATLDKAKAKAAEVAKSVQTLLGAGVSNGFLQNLVQSGNTELIVQLAGAPDVSTLAAQYDAVIKQNEDTGRVVAEQVIGARLDTVNQNLIALAAEQARYAHELREDRRQPMEIKLSGEKQDAISRGREYTIAISAYEKAGGRKTA